MNKTPILIIGAVLVIAAAGAYWFYNSSSQPQPSASSNSPAKNTTASTPKAAQTIPAGAPAGAQPPEQSGSTTAVVTLEEFADLQCGSCAAAHKTMNEIKSMYGSKINFIFRNFPLPMHDKGYEAAVAASAAGMQGKFWDMQNMLFQNQQAWASDKAYKQTWKGYAQKIGLDVAKWESDLIGMGAKARVDKDMERGKAIGINSTPTLFVNGTAVEFKDMQVEPLKKLIDAELQKAGGGQSAPAAKSDNSNK